MSNVVVNLGNLYPQQMAIRDALRKGIKRIAFIGSVQVGKSWLGARLLIDQAFTNNNPDSNLIICVSPNHVMGRVMRREFELALQMAPALWESVLKTRKQSPIPTYTFPNGKIVEFHSVDNPDTIRGLRPAFILCDEAAYFSAEAWDVIEGRTTQTAASIVITTTPRGKRHWLYKKVFAKAAPPGHVHHHPHEYNPDRFFMQVATIFDNPYIPEEERDAKIEAYGGRNSLWARQELFGDFVEYEGLVYTAFDEDRMSREVEDMPNPWTYEFVSVGVDFGWTDPNVAVVAGLKKGKWYIFDEFYKSNVEIDRFGTVLNGFRGESRIMRFWADSADPGKIDHYMRSGLPMYPVQKPRINQRIQYLNSLFAQGRLVISKKCTNLLHELTTYQWPHGKENVNEATTKPIGPDHALDALAYVLWSERNLLSATNITYGDPIDWGKPFDPTKGLTPNTGGKMTAGYFD
jgi:PBSX family phage terminase large subunit